MFKKDFKYQDILTKIISMRYVIDRWIPYYSLGFETPPENPRAFFTDSPTEFPQAGFSIAFISVWEKYLKTLHMLNGWS